MDSPEAIANKGYETFGEHFMKKGESNAISVFEKLGASPETEDIDRLVKWYQTDSNTRIRYMTWQEEIDDANDRADNAEARADDEKARADKYEKMLRELGKL